MIDTDSIEQKDHKKTGIGTSGKMNLNISKFIKLKVSEN